jgi:hypothetical protein
MAKSRDPSPTPSEQKRIDAEAREREQAEQDKLPYKWTQTLEEAEVFVPGIPSNFKGRDLIVELKKTHIKVGIKGQDPVIDVGFIFHFLFSSVCVIEPRSLTLMPSVSTHRVTSPLP